MRYKIITQQVLNKDTGELESQDYKAVESKRTIRGGFMISYKSYDEIQVETLKSALDIKIFLYIRDKFTYKRIESSLSARTIADDLSTTPSKVSTLIKVLVKKDFLKRIDRGIYRMNPFMFIPYKSKGTTLQKEWTQLEKDNDEAV